MESMKKHGKGILVAALTSLVALNFFPLALYKINTAEAAIPTPGNRTGLYSGESKFSLNGSYYFTRRNFNDSGTRSSLGSDNDLWWTKGTAAGLLGISDDFAAFANFQYNYINVHSPGRNHYYSGLGDGSLGGHYEPKQAPLPLWLDLEFQFPMYSRSAPSDWNSQNGVVNTPAGNGIMELSAVGVGEIPFNKNVALGLGAGYAYATNGFSAHIPYLTYLKYEELRYFFFRFGVSGQLSTQTDVFTDNPGAQDRSNNVMAGSKAFNSINPTTLNLDIGAGIYLTKEWFLASSFQSELFGQNTSQGFFASLGMGYHFGAPAPKAPVESGLGYRSSNRGFQQYEMTQRIVQVNNSLNMHLISGGAPNGVRPGEYLDIFEPNDPETNEPGQAIARVVVLEVGQTRSKVEVKEFYKRRKIEEGFVVRRPIR